MDMDLQEDQDLWEDHLLVLLLMVIHKEDHLPEQFQHTALVALQCHMEVPQICKTYKGC